MAEEGTKSGERESKGATDPCTGEADPKHSEWFFDPDGDLEILSSDNVLFKVHAFHLQSASSVFREMVSCAKSPRLELCDAAIETALTLTDFLNVVIHDDDQWMRAPLDTDITSVDRGCHLIAFLRKYECDKALSQIRRHLRYMCSLYSSGKTSHGPPFVFTFAAVLDDTDICTDALQATGSATWIRNPIHGDLGVPVHGYLSDPSTLPLYALKVIPPEYLWAWMRAYQHTFGASKDAGSKDSRKSGKDDKAMAAEFSRLMAVIEARKKKSGESDKVVE